MINTKFFLLASVCVFFNGNSQAAGIKNLTFDYSGSSLVNISHTTHIHTPMELKPISSLDNAIRFTAVCSIGGGGCNGLSFDGSNNSMALDDDSQCSEEGYVRSCPPGQVRDENNLCPYDSSYFKCRGANNSCDDGYILNTTCGAEQTVQHSYTNEAGNTCTLCQDKSCQEGGLSDTITSCQKGTAVSFANQTCYQDVTDKSCEDMGYYSAVPTNHKCTPITECEKSCQSECHEPTCEEEGLLSSCPVNHDCTEENSYGKTCYKDKGQPSCSDGGYKTDIPTNNVCTQVEYFGNRCFDNCYQPTCENGGYLAACPAGQTGTAITYYGRNCYNSSECKANTTLPILYSDMTTSYTVIEGKTPIGIVFDEDKKLAVALEYPNESFPWSYNNTDVLNLTNCPTEELLSCETDGKANTAAILLLSTVSSIERASIKEFSSPAAKASYGYTTEGTQAGDWHLPSAKELNSIYNVKNKIETMMNLLGRPTQLNGNWYWSSNEYTAASYAFMLDINTGKISYFTKEDHNFMVLPVLAFGETDGIKVPVSDCKTAGSQYFDTVESCNCPYGAIGEKVTTASSKKTCYRCGTSSECSIKTCALCRHRIEPCNGGIQGSSCACGGYHNNPGITDAHYCVDVDLEL